MPSQPNLPDDERRRLQAAYAEIAELAGGLAHEIRNPLSTIHMNLELLVEDLEGGDSARDQRLLRKIRTIQRECSHLDDILNAFLQFARVGELELVDADLNPLVREFIDFYQAEAAEAGVDVSPHLDPDLPRVRLDRALMRQVLLNLALNAQQAMPEGGLIELQTKLTDGEVLLEMIDSGTGVDETTRAKMFQAFYSTKPGGSGLGLPTVRKIVEAHHGTISCESEPGRGTRFTIALPPADEQDSS